MLSVCGRGAPDHGAFALMKLSQLRASDGSAQRSGGMANARAIVSGVGAARMVTPGEAARRAALRRSAWVTSTFAAQSRRM